LDDPSYFKHVRKEILPLMTAAPRCLEVGCASGRTLEWLKTKRLIEWTAGIDVQHGLEMSPLDWFQAGDAESMTLPEALDAVLCLDVLEHLRQPEKLLVRIREALKPDGFLILSVPNVANYRVAIRLLFGRWNYRDSGLLDRTHLRFFTRHSIVSLVESCGFRVELQRTTAYGADIPMRVLTLNQSPLFHFQYLIRARKA